jgi:hypothetical protein
MTAIRVEGLTGSTHSGFVTSESVFVKNATGTTIREGVIRRAPTRGAGDFATTDSKYLSLVVLGNGTGATYSDGLLLQGARTEVAYCSICDNGDDPAYEHGIYVSRVARDVFIHDNVIRGNSGAGIRFVGTGRAVQNLIDGNRLGMVFAEDVPGQIVSRYNVIRATEYAYQCDLNFKLGRLVSDYNVFSPGARFRINAQGLNVDLAGWRKATGQDLHSVIA